MQSPSVTSIFDVTKGWVPHVGPGINSVTPAQYGWQVTPEGNALFTMGGNAYGGWLASESLPYEANTGNLKLSLAIRISASALVNGQAIEIECKWTGPDGLTSDGSFQINIAEGWMLQSDKAGSGATAGAWTDWGVKIPPLVPDTWIPVEIVYKDTLLTSSVVSVAIDGVTYPGPAWAQGIPRLKLGWSEGLQIQVQEDENQNGFGWELEIQANPVVTWW